MKQGDEAAIRDLRELKLNLEECKKLITQLKSDRLNAAIPPPPSTPPPKAEAQQQEQQQQKQQQQQQKRLSDA